MTSQRAADGIGQRTVLLTGGSSGIGRGMADELIRRGADVFVVARREPTAWENGVPSDWPTSRWIRADLADGEAGLSSVAAWLSAKGPTIDAVFYSAVTYSGLARHAFEDTTVADWDRLHAVNLRSCFLLLRMLIPALRRRPEGLIALVGSDARQVPAPGRVAYAATKAGLSAIARGLAAELNGTSIRVVEIVPAGQVATPGLRRRRPAGFDFSSYTDPAVFGPVAAQLVASMGAGLNGATVCVDQNGEMHVAEA